MSKHYPAVLVNSAAHIETYAKAGAH